MIDLDRAAREVVFFNVVFLLFGSFMIVVGMRLPEPTTVIVSARIVMMTAYAFGVAALALALLHRNVERKRYRNIWLASIACTWASSLLIADAVLMTPFRPSSVLYVVLGVVLLLAATSIRAGRPRANMWLRIDSTRRLHERIGIARKQIPLPL